MRIINEQELKDILDKHGKWLRNEEGGERADLRSANLTSADLTSANLTSADLTSAILTYANLRSANLTSANLTSANLRSANLAYANLTSANLRSADLTSADLTYANLRSADLTSADLTYANLRSADLLNMIGLKFKPIQIVNTKFFVTIFDDSVQWGCRKFTFDEVKALTLEQCQEIWDENEFKLNKKIITEMIRYYRR